METPPSFWKRLLKGCLVVIGVASVCCCLGLGRLVDGLPTLTARPDEPVKPRGPANLGVALVPEDTAPERARTYTWEVEGLIPSTHRVGYALDPTLAQALEREFLAYGRRLGYRSLGPDRFTYHAPDACREDMRCIYDELMQTNARPVRALGLRFQAYIWQHQLDAAQAVDLIIGFVQGIHYEMPEDMPFGIVPPALVPAQNRGDCDSKAVLAVMLLRQVGIDAVVLYSDPLSHAAVGVGLPGRGTELRLGARAYRYAEVTAEGWPVGMIPPKYDKPRLWKVLPPPELTGG